MTSPLIAFYYYYGGGLLWICLCLAIGAMRAQGDPSQIVAWVIVSAAMWPLLLAKIILDLARGDDWTDLT